MGDESFDKMVVEHFLSSSSSSSSSPSSSSSSSSADPTSSDSVMCWLSSDEEIANSVDTFNQRESKHRVDNFIEDVVRKYSDEEFRRNFRLSRTIASKLIHMYEQSPHYKTRLSGGRKGITAESQCLAFLWFAGNKSTFREVSNLFNTAPSAAHTHLSNIIQFLFDISAQIIKFPNTPEEKEQKSSDFDKIARFPDVLGSSMGVLYTSENQHTKFGQLMSTAMV